MSTIVLINGTEYELSHKLRVAYMIQDQHNHKPYTEVFKEMASMTLENQIKILYAAFSIENKAENPKTKRIEPIMTAQEFLDYYLDNFTLTDVMDQLQSVIKGITGNTDDNKAEDGSEGNQ